MIIYKLDNYCEVRMLLNKLWKEIRSNPFSVLGIQKIEKRYYIRILLNDADSVKICNINNNQEIVVLKNRDGFFYIELEDRIDYVLKYKKDDHEWIEKDPYSFPPVISDYDLHLFSEGTHRRVWEMLGAHITECQGIAGTVFAVWAPNAKSVRLIGEFNNWDKNRFYMRPRSSSGIWEFFLPEVVHSVKYKFAVESMNGYIVEKSDPFAFCTELRPNTASITYQLQDTWGDQEWVQSRSNHINQALSIYECHLDSWIRDEKNNSLSYCEIVIPLAEYILEHGFTHVELIGILEYPFDGSWGYQVTGYYAPTARYGSPNDFMCFVDYLHKCGIGVILDWVPAHFPNDAHGLGNFDGTALYEHEDPKLGWHNDWGTYIFNYGRSEVSQFLIGSALYWLDVFHIDGLRVDAVASMLYLDYSRKDGEWIPNKYGGRENLEAIKFLQSLHTEIERYYPNVMTIAEESTSYPKVTAPISEGGLGFTYKWNMGWMNDTLNYFSIDPLFRSWHHQEITFSLMYAFNEHFVLPFSHDEVVHGKGTLLDRMPGNDWEKFANLRLMYSYMWAYPGKKLLFAGQEWAPWQEWCESQSIDWHLNSYALHTGMRYLIKDLNHLYNTESALYQIDSDSSTFQWIDCDNTESGLLIWVREDYIGNKILIVLNLNTIIKEHYRVGTPVSGSYREIFNSDSTHYGGANILNDQYIHTEKISWQDQENSLLINIGPLSAVMFKISPY